MHRQTDRQTRIDTPVLSKVIYSTHCTFGTLISNKKFKKWSWHGFNRKILCHLGNASHYTRVVSQSKFLSSFVVTLCSSKRQNQVLAIPLPLPISVHFRYWQTLLHAFVYLACMEDVRGCCQDNPLLCQVWCSMVHSCPKKRVTWKMRPVLFEKHVVSSHWWQSKTSVNFNLVNLK